MTYTLTSHKLEHFNEVFVHDIYPIYKANQDTFDPDGVHGVLHISRSIIAALTMAEKAPEGINPDLMAIFYATAFHDSARRSNGPDYWEIASYENCLEFCKNNGIPNAQYVASLIPKSLPKPNDYNYICVHDADVLEIMRPCCGMGGLGSFKREFMMLYKTQPTWCDGLIPKWFKFILETEAKKTELSGPDSFEKCLEIFDAI